MSLIILFSTSATSKSQCVSTHSQLENNEVRNNETERRKGQNKHLRGQCNPVQRTKANIASIMIDYHSNSDYEM